MGNSYSIYRFSYHIFSDSTILLINCQKIIIQHNNKNISIVVPHIHGLGEKFRKTCKNKGIQVHFKGPNTVKTPLMAPKDKDHKLQKSGIIYKFKFPDINCPEEYIGESGRTLGDRVKDHLRATFPNPTGHPVSPDCFTIVHREPQGNKRTLRRPCSSG